MQHYNSLSAIIGFFEPFSTSRCQLWSRIAPDFVFLVRPFRLKHP